MEDFTIIAFTHKVLPLETIGKLHLNHDEQAHVLGAIKLNFGIGELLYLSTCNRVEFFIKSEREIDSTFIAELLRLVNSRLSNGELESLLGNSEMYYGNNAVEHVLKVASSLDSLVVGEREIITQVRKAYDYCNMLGLTGDFIRLLIKQTIETAKEIYTTTDIAKNPVSVVSLAYRQLRTLGIKNEARILFVGSGETNSLMAAYLQKHKFANFCVFNRTLANARKLAGILNGKFFGLDELRNYKEGFDVLIVCTSSSTPIIDKELYSSLLAGEKSRKTLIDLGLPANIDELVVSGFDNHYININVLKQQAEANLQLRKSEVTKCEQLIQLKVQQFKSAYKERKIELAFGEIPRQVKAIKDLAIQEVFSKEINLMDASSKEILDKVLTYMEKKYNAVAIKTAKEVLLNQKS